MKFQVHVNENGSQAIIVDNVSGERAFREAWAFLQTRPTAVICICDEEGRYIDVIGSQVATSEKD